jgi:hypothetical protein
MIDRRAGLLPTVAVVLLVAGCTVPTATDQDLSPRLLPTPTVTSPSRAEAPGSRVPLGCAELFSSAALDAIAGAKAVVQLDENSAPQGLLSIAQAQYGAQDCEWDGGVGIDPAGSGAHLSVDIAPEAGDAFAARFDALMTDQTYIGHPVATENVAGDRSGFWCANEIETLGADGPSHTCDAEMLVSGYWVSVNVGDVVGQTRAQLTDRLTTSLTRIAPALRAAASPQLPWMLPASSPPGFCATDPSTSQVRAIVGDRTLQFQSGASASDWPAEAGTIGRVGREVTCDWAGNDKRVDLELLAGGSWAISRMKPVGPVDAAWGRTPYRPLSVSGASAAVASCDGETCDAYLAVRTSAVEIVYPDPGTAKNPAVLAAFAAAIASS